MKDFKITEAMSMEDQENIIKNIGNKIEINCVSIYIQIKT